MTNNIASERKRLGMSQEKFAEELGTTRSSIKQYEAGSTSINSSMLLKMADLCGCSIDYLMGRCDDRVSHLRVVNDAQLFPAP